jgi:hypothetical protein
VDHSAEDWEVLGLDFAKLFAHVPESAHAGQSRADMVAMLREQLMQAQAKGEASGEGENTYVGSLIFL